MNDKAGLQVLGVGLPRTGTASMRKALDILGYRCYHMFEVLEDAQRSRDWQSIYQQIEAGQHPSFDGIFKGYTAAVDAPAETVWKEIFRDNPNVKIILTSRPSKQWKQSVDNTIMRIVTDPVYPFLVYWVPRLYEQYRLAKFYILPVWTRKYGEMKEVMMDDRIADVKSAGLSSDQLLDFDLASGWEPLCKFLGKPIPAVPFPRVNDKDEFGKFMETQIKIGMQRWAGVMVAAAVGLGLVFRQFRR